MKLSYVISALVFSLVMVLGLSASSVLADDIREDLGVHRVSHVTKEISIDFNRLMENLVIDGNRAANYSCSSRYELETPQDATIPLAEEASDSRESYEMVGVSVYYIIRHNEVYFRVISSNATIQNWPDVCPGFMITAARHLNESNDDGGPVRLRLIELRDAE